MRFRLCQDCNQNSTTCSRTHCETTEKGIVLANRQYPAESIQVCHNDILVIDVVNNIPSYGLTLHWRGQPQHEAPFMDGVPMVTQCAIPSFTTFQYKFRASAPGTHFYHAFSDKDRTQGLFGALVVRQSDKVDPHKKLYDEDKKEHVIMLSEWINSNGKVEKILINGQTSAEEDKMKSFKVKHGKRYRFRMAYGAGISDCPLILKIQEHYIRVIAMDGNAIKPIKVESLVLSKGERSDFVLNANGEKDSYLLEVESQCLGKNLTGSALIEYTGFENGKVQNDLLDTKLVEISDHEIPNHIKEISQELQAEVDHKFYLGYDYKYYEGNSVHGKYFVKTHN